MPLKLIKRLLERRVDSKNNHLQRPDIESLEKEYEALIAMETRQKDDEIWKKGPETAGKNGESTS